MIVFVVMIESETGARGAFSVYATEHGASTAAREMARHHYKAWYEPMQVLP